MFGSKGIPEYPEPRPTGVKCGNFTSGGFGECLLSADEGAYWGFPRLRDTRLWLVDHGLDMILDLPSASQCLVHRLGRRECSTTAETISLKAR